MSNPPNSERDEPIFLEEFRNVFLKRGSTQAPPSPPSTSNVVATDPKRGRLPLEPVVKKKLRKNSLKRGVAAVAAANAVPLPQVKASKVTVTTTNKVPKYIRRFRLRSLPIILYRQNLPRRGAATMAKGQFVGGNVGAGIGGSRANINVSLTNGSQMFNNTLLAHPESSHHHHSHNHHHPIASPPLLPPINSQLLKEIDLHEILKNPQLRHDILFDPQLQFRPNLDGERGKRKKNIIDGYWQEIERESHGIFILRTFNEHNLRIPSLFATLRDILLSLLPYKDRQAVTDVMDMDLLVQQLSVGTFDFVSLAQWLGRIFKQHCAPMRDNWVSEMVLKFVQAFEENSVTKLVSGLRMVFSILEAMKLDVANHQIRILRPVLVETAVEFERDYFNQLISHNKLDIQDSLRWYLKNFSGDEREHLVIAILDLLSCRKMVGEFPLTLAFDHTRLILLRADIRQLVCIQLCVVLYKQLVLNSGQVGKARMKAMSPEVLARVQEEILSIVTDDNGTIKWTRNVNAIALQLVKNAYDDSIPQSVVEFAHGWLLKQIQPQAEVYGLMEEKVFKELVCEINEILKSPNAANIPSGQTKKPAKILSGISSGLSSTSIASPISSTPSSNNAKNSDNTNNKNNSNNSSGSSLNPSSSSTGTSSIATRIATLANFHWNVFGLYYTEYLQHSTA